MRAWIGSCKLQVLWDCRTPSCFREALSAAARGRSRHGELQASVPGQTRQIETATAACSATKAGTITETDMRTTTTVLWLVLRNSGDDMNRHSSKIAEVLRAWTGVCVLYTSDAMEAAQVGRGFEGVTIIILIITDIRVTIKVRAVAVTITPIISINIKTDTMIFVTKKQEVASFCNRLSASPGVGFLNPKLRLGVECEAWFGITKTTPACHISIPTDAQEL